MVMGKPTLCVVQNYLFSLTFSRTLLGYTMRPHLASTHYVRLKNIHLIPTNSLGWLTGLDGCSILTFDCDSATALHSSPVIHRFANILPRMMRLHVSKTESRHTFAERCENFVFIDSHFLSIPLPRHTKLIFFTRNLALEKQLVSCEKKTRHRQHTQPFLTSCCTTFIY